MAEGSIKRGIGMGFGGCIGVIVFIIVIFIIIGAMMSSGDSKNKAEKSQSSNTTSTSPTTELKSSTPVAGKSYQEVYTLNGNGVKKSEPFTIAGDRFKIKYDCKGDLCQAWVKRVGSDFDIQMIMNTSDPVNDETIFYKPGEYYIESNTIGTYSMTVEDYK